MRNYYAVLVDKKVVPVGVEEWRLQIEGSFPMRVVAKTTIGETEISTVFLGINHGFSGKDLWFETMIFGGPHDQYQDRYETYEEAEEAHYKLVSTYPNIEGQ